jgi:SAM-dependent methyltransferase
MKIRRYDALSRLNRQFNFHKTLFDYPQLVPPGIDITHVSRIIDVGAGTGAWALDLMSHPDVRDRDLQVFACDISTAKFPRNDEPEVRKITFFEQDVTKAFPDEFIGTFDLINLSCLSYGLTAQGWKVALRNLYSLLSELRPRNCCWLFCPLIS